MIEVWKDIEGFDGKYQISSWGRVRSARGTLKTYENKKGYLKIGLYKNGKYHKRRINRLVAQAFIPNPYDLPQVNHIDGNKKNNSVTNLEWVTDSANKKHDKHFRITLEIGTASIKRYPQEED